MYKKLINKYHLFKVFTLVLPKTNNINKSCFYLCRYIIRKTPYGDINIFFKEVLKLINIFYSNSFMKSILIFCTHKIYINYITKNQSIKYVTLNDKLFNEKHFSNILWFAVFYSDCKYKNIAYFKDRKIPTIGFINFNKHPNLTDFTVLLESKFFCSLFLFNFIIKKILKKNDIK